MGKDVNTDRKFLLSVYGDTLRDIVKFINEEQISKEDIWRMEKVRDQYVLLYFK